jgi:hypothetical protein
MMDVRCRQIRWEMVVALVVVQGAGMPGSARPEATLGSRVVDFAKAHLDEKVGNGECWTLAFEALQAARARLPGRNGYGVYVFGKEVRLNDLQPGDVLQMEKVRIEGSEGTTWTFPHHTVIVEKVSGKSVTLLHQNFGGKLKVHRLSLNLGEKTAGTIQAYRPQPR